ncbi:MAG: hypothetical protein HQK50_19485, partial [Oligoflexia bacterium]|nr:hypothetical protein [Oligoflexia bacterium]
EGTILEHRSSTKTTIQQKQQPQQQQQQQQQQRLPKATKVDAPVIVNGEFQVDQQGHLLATYDIKLIFDQFLNFDSQNDQETRERILHGFIENKLKEPALSEAKSILKKYL